MAGNECEYTLDDWRKVNRYVRSLEILYEILHNNLNNPDYTNMADMDLNRSIINLHEELSVEIVKMNTLKNDIVKYLKNKVDEQK